MSTIQTQISLVHLPSGLNLGSAWQRDAVEDAFSAASISVTSSPESLSLGDVTVPRQVILKLSSGDDVLISVDGVTYPMSVSGSNDTCILNLDSRTVYSVECLPDSVGSLNDTYFRIHDADGPVLVWYNVDAGGTAPTVTTERLIEVEIVAGAMGDAVASATQTAINSSTDTAFLCERDSADLTIYPKAQGDTGGMTPSSTDFAISSEVIVGGVTVKSLGTSQLVFGIAPV